MHRKHSGKNLVCLYGGQLIIDMNLNISTNNKEMLEHQKQVINGVGNNKILFRKELKKSIAWLNAAEQAQLKTWVKENFGELYPEIIQEVFYHSYNIAS